MQYKLPKNVLLQTYGKNINVKYNSNTSCLIALSQDLEDISSISNKDSYPICIKVKGMSSDIPPTQKTSNFYFDVDKMYAEAGESNISDYSIGYSSSWFLKSYVDTAYTNLAESDKFYVIANSSDSGYYIRQKNFTSLTGEKYLHVYMDVDNNSEPPVYRSNNIESFNTRLNITADGDDYTGVLSLNSNKDTIVGAYESVTVQVTPRLSTQTSKITLTEDRIDYSGIPTHYFDSLTEFKYSTASDTYLTFLSAKKQVGSAPKIILGDSTFGSVQTISIIGTSIEIDGTSIDSPNGVFLHGGDFDYSLDTYDAQIRLGNQGVFIEGYRGITIESNQGVTINGISIGGYNGVIVEDSNGVTISNSIGVNIHNLNIYSTFSNSLVTTPNIYRFNGDLNIKNGAIFQLVIRFQSDSHFDPEVVFSGTTFSDLKDRMDNLQNNSYISNIYYGIALNNSRTDPPYSSNPHFYVLKGFSSNESTFLDGIEAVLLENIVISSVSSNTVYVRVNCISTKDTVISTISSSTAEIVEGPHEY